MTLAPLLHASFAIRLHVATVAPAALIGTYLIFVSRKGAPWHRALGYLYLGLMSVTAVTTLWVHSLMPHGPFFGFSPVHLLIPLTLFGVYNALREPGRTTSFATVLPCSASISAASFWLAGLPSFPVGSCTQSCSATDVCAESADPSLIRAIRPR